jgi:hypothetical protein
LKNSFLLAVIVLTANFIRSLDFVFPMYFEDVLGNRHTVYIGCDPNGSCDVILPEFGELDITHIPFDPMFDVRITNQADISCGETTEEPFHTKKKIILPPNSFYFWPRANIDIHTLHWPVKASWDPALFNKPQHEGVLFTSVHPMGWRDVICYPVCWGDSNFNKVIMLQLPENMPLAQAQVELYSPSGRLLYKVQPMGQFHKIEVAYLL